MIFLLVEDEFPTRQELRFVLEQLVPEATFYEASDGDEALSLVGRLNPDVVFLDINMPRVSGLQAAAMLIDAPEPPLIVFATAYDEHALKAFELAAIDYVVKPFSKRRLSKTVDKLRLRLGEKQRLVKQKEVIEQFLAERPEPKQAKLWVEGGNNTRLLLPYSDIAYIEARDKRVYVNTINGVEHEARYTLKELDSRLASHNFCRTHKAYIVNLSSVAELIPWFSGGYQLRLNDKKSSTVAVSRRYATALKAQLDR